MFVVPLPRFFVSKNIVMKKIMSLMLGTILATSGYCANNQDLMFDVYQTPIGRMGIYHVGHASLILSYKSSIIHIDPYSAQGNYAALPKADLVLITHEHSDHLDMAAIKEIQKPSTQFITSKAAAESLPKAKVLRNGESAVWNGITIEAYPAYNVVHKRDANNPYHPKGRGNAYLLSFGTFKLYIGGDTEDIDEFNLLKSKEIDVAFLPKNLPYTMTDAMFIHAAEMIAPKVVYPYHYFELDNATSIQKELAGAGITMKVFNKK
jgi:L-ascorbate metabolism protein UlaG (beta-lactamase superfamily)